MQEDISSKLPAMEGAGVFLTLFAPAHADLGLVVLSPPSHSLAPFISSPLPSIPHFFLAGSWLLLASTSASLPGLFLASSYAWAELQESQMYSVFLPTPTSPGMALEPDVVG